MKVPFMSDYAKRLVQVCHRHEAHAMGGMSAFIPSRRDEEVNKMAIEQVTKDKEIEVFNMYFYVEFFTNLFWSFESVCGIFHLQIFTKPKIAQITKKLEANFEFKIYIYFLLFENTCELF